MAKTRGRTRRRSEREAVRRLAMSEYVGKSGTLSGSGTFLDGRNVFVSLSNEEGTRLGVVEADENGTPLDPGMGSGFWVPADSFTLSEDTHRVSRRRAAQTKTARKWESRVPVSYFALPKGTHPADRANRERVAKTISAATGFEDVKVALMRNERGQTLTESYHVSVGVPLKVGKFVSLADLDDDQAELISDIIDGLSNDEDVSVEIEDLADTSEGSEESDSDDGDSEDDADPADSEDDDEFDPEEQFGKGSSRRGSRNSLARALGVSGRDASRIAMRVRGRQVAEARRILATGDGLPFRVVTASGKPYSAGEVKEIMRLAGDTRAPLVERTSGQRSSVKTRRTNGTNVRQSRR